VGVAMMAHHLIMVKICAKLFKKKLMNEKIMDKTRNKPSIRQF
jgi:hypothetical protein